MLPGALYRALKKQAVFVEASPEVVSAFDGATALRQGRGERYRIAGPAPALGVILAELALCVQEAEDGIARVDDLCVDLNVLRRMSRQPLVRAA